MDDSESREESAEKRASEESEAVAAEAEEEKADFDEPAMEKTVEREFRDPKKIAEVVNIFQRDVSAGLIGQGTRQRNTGTPGSLTGKIDEAEVTAETLFYCQPAHFEEALGRLETDHVVSICGAVGTGKRTGGISLLRTVTSGQLVVMSAINDLTELSVRTYTEGYGYLIVDRAGGDTQGDVDFAWRTVRDRVRRCGAHLVVTTISVDTDVGSVAHIAWSRPSPQMLSRAYLANQEISDAEISTVAEHLTAEYSMADITGALRAIREGEPSDVVLERLSATSARRVQEWFGRRKADLSTVLDLSALAFLGAVSYREFESLRAGLDACLRHHGMINSDARGAAQKEQDESQADVPDCPVFDRRCRFADEEGLIGEQRVTGRTSERRVLWFRNDSYRRHVLAELSRRCETPFWNAVADWLTEMIRRQPKPTIAIGLAELAGVDFEEVEHAYLNPWSRGDTGPTGQTMAVFIVWAMCFRDDTRPIALKVVKQWANHGDPEQRWVAAMAYSGVLGACDPTQAIRQLWQLIVNSARGFDQACYAMAMLFGMLLETGSAGKVLTTLRQQLDRAPNRSIDRVIITRARQVLAQLLVMRENRPRVPVTFLYLERHPERRDLVARLWAEGIRYRPYRHDVLRALWYGLNRLHLITDDSLEFARGLGEAIVFALPANEVESFYEQFKTIDACGPDRDRPRPSPAQVLLEVVGRYYRRKAS